MPIPANDSPVKRFYAVLIGGPQDGAVKELDQEEVPSLPGEVFPTEPVYRAHVPDVYRLADGTAYELMEFLPWWMEKAPALEPGVFPYVHHRYNRGGGRIGTR